MGRLLLLDLLSNDLAVMDVSLVHVGLAIVSAFFVLAGYALIYEQPLQSSAELHAIAEQIESVLYEVDSYWFEQEKTSIFPQNDHSIFAEIGPDFIRLTSAESDYQQIVIPVPQRLWIASRNVSFNSSESCHQLVFNISGHFGTRNDPCVNDILVTTWFSSLWNYSQNRFYTDPILWNDGEAVIVEKCIIFKEIQLNGGMKSVPLIEFLIVRIG